MKITVYEWMEDFDNAELPDGAWQQVLEESVMEYNDIYGTKHDPFETWLKYCKRKKYDHNER